MEDVDIVLGYLWMESIGTININVENKFLKLQYKKNKTTLQDNLLIKQEEPKMIYEEVFIGKLVVVPINTSDEEPMVES